MTGDELKALRTKWKLTQQSLGEKLHYNNKHICSLEKGKYPIPKKLEDRLHELDALWDIQGRLDNY